MKTANRIAFILLCLADSGAFSAESLYVFFPSTVRPQNLQRKIAAINPGIEVTVFGRYADFREEVDSHHPDAILTLPEVLKPLDGYPIKVAGKRSGGEDEGYFLLSVDQVLDIGKVDKLTIGAVDFLGRKGMKAFIAGMFRPPPHIKTVTKIEDLLPLIIFKMVHAILVTESQAAFIQGVSNLEFTRIPVPDIKAGAVSLAVRNGRTVPGVMRTMKSMDRELLKLMGDVQWK